MNRFGLAAATVLASAGVAAAQAETLTYAGAQVVRYGGSEWIPSTGVDRATAAYTNVNLASTSFTRNFGTNTPGTRWIMGDDLQSLNLTGGTLLDEMTFSVVNGNSASATGGGVAINVPANQLIATVAIWSILPGDFAPTAPNFETRAPLGSFSVALPALNSLTFTNLTVTGLASLNINLTANVWAGVVFDDNPLDAGDFSSRAFRYGQVISNQAATVGFSDGAFFFRDQINGIADAGGFQFAAPTISNFTFDLQTVPTPGAACLLGFGALAATRRRRG